MKNPYMGTRNVLMQQLLAISFLVFTPFLLVNCDDSSTSDPATAERSELNAPGQVWTLTGDSEITLAWTTRNAEEDFKGYYVFGTTADLGALKAGYPKDVDLTVTGVPRCELNSKVLEKFGFPASTADCEGATEEEEGKKAALTAEEKTSDAATLKDKRLPCEGVDSPVLSLPATKALDTKECRVKKVYDPDSGKLVDIKNGATYSFIVFAVMGDEYETLSWSSAIVKDTPSTSFPLVDSTGTAVKKIGLSISSNTPQFRTITIDFEKKTATLSGEANCTAPICHVTTENTTTGAAATLYLGRNSNTTGALSTSATNHHRAMLSVSSTGTVKILQRGPQTGLKDGAVSGRKLGDEASKDFNASISKYQLTPLQVYDLQLTQSGKTYYGKIVVKSVSLDDAADNKSTLRMDVEIIFQEQAGSTHYLVRKLR